MLRTYIDYENMKKSGELENLKAAWRKWGVTEISRKLGCSRNNVYYLIKKLNSLMVKNGESPFFVNETKDSPPLRGRPKSIEKKKKTSKRTGGRYFSVPIDLNSI